MRLTHLIDQRGQPPRQVDHHISEGEHPAQHHLLVAIAALSLTAIARASFLALAVSLATLAATANLAAALAAVALAAVALAASLAPLAVAAATTLASVALARAVAHARRRRSRRRR